MTHLRRFVSRIYDETVRCANSQIRNFVVSEGFDQFDGASV